MIVLRAIGNFFRKIWNWIKDTAWVQPLLIVGLIFGVIFAIPSIVKGITKLNDELESSEAYYTKFQKSLQKGKDSEADKITTAIEEEEFTAYGEKFFLVFVETGENCANCTAAKEGFELLEKNFDDKYKPNDGLPFKMYTIFADEVTDDSTSSETAFRQYLDRHVLFFEEVASNAYEFDYYINGKINESDLIGMHDAAEDFLTPTILLIDNTESNQTGFPVSEVMFGVSGDKSSNKAELLLDCWNHEGDFAIEKE